MIEIIVNPQEIESATRFANQVVGTNRYYSDRGQSNKDTIIHQIFVGKVGEYAVRQWYVQKGFTCSEVDVTVTHKKTFEPDLRVDGHACHVKSQSMESAQRFGISWTFQFAGSSGAGHRDHEIFDTYSEHDRVIFCVVNPPAVKIMAEVKVTDLHQLGLFDLPKKKELVEYKRVVYFNKIPRELLVK